MRRWYAGLTFLALAGALALLRWRLPERGVEEVGAEALIDSAFALGLLILVVLIAVGAGRAVLRLLRIANLTSFERALFSAALGLGTIAVGVTALAFAGGLRPTWIAVWLGTMAALAAVDTARRPPDWGAAGRGLRVWWGERSAGERLGLGLGVLLLVPALLMALSPPWDYDGLMYHLQAPRLFLAQGRLSLLPDLWQANGPLATEMLFAIGLGFGSDTFAKVLHLSFGVLLVLSTIALGERVIGRGRGALAGLVLLGLPTLPFWASAAYADVAWAAFESLALLALIVWLEAKEPRVLWLAGLLAGLALSTKSIALFLLPGAVLTVLAGRWREWPAAMRDAFRFLTPAAVVCAPWYLKNLILAGNPVYPLVLGGPEWPAARLDLLEAYLQSFGMGRTVADYLLLPLRIFARPTAFGTFARALEFPGLLFLLAPAFPQAWRSRIPRIIGGSMLLRIAFWALGSQQTRFLLPVFPSAAVFAAGALGELDRIGSRSRWMSRLSAALVLTSLIGALGFAVAVPAVLRFDEVVLGKESKASFLRRVAGDYRAVEFIHAEVPVGSRVLLMWDGRGFYCDERCLPDAEQSRWTWYVEQGKDVEGVAELLRQDGIEYLMHSSGDARFILEHDPTGANRRAQLFFLQVFREACTHPLSLHPATEVYQVTCGREA